MYAMRGGKVAIFKLALSAAVGRMRNRLQFLAAGIFGGGNEEVGAFFAAHAYGVVLAGLATANLAVGFLFDTTTVAVIGRVNRRADDLVALGGIILVDKARALDKTARQVMAGGKIFKY